MATNKWRRHDSETRDRFEDILDDFIDERTGKPVTKDYQLQEVNQYQGRVSVHREALKNAPLTQGDTIKQHYFANLGMVILDLNPTAKED
jgi:hypothetical protein